MQPRTRRSAKRSAVHGDQDYNDALKARGDFAKSWLGIGVTFIRVPAEYGGCGGVRRGTLPYARFGQRAAQLSISDALARHHLDLPPQVTNDLIGQAVNGGWRDSDYLLSSTEDEDAERN